MEDAPRFANTVEAVEELLANLDGYPKGPILSGDHLHAFVDTLKRILNFYACSTLREKRKIKKILQERQKAEDCAKIMHL